MKVLILAAGYATRMYPLTRDIPKPLLLIKGKPIIEYLLEDLERDGRIKEYLIITNHKFYPKFKEWKERLPYRNKIRLLDDGSTENQNRLGAVRDMEYVINKMELQEDLFVLAGDNVLDFSLSIFIEEFYHKTCSMVMCYKEKEIEKLRKTGVAEITEEGILFHMEEKPEDPKGEYAIPPFYLFRKEDLSDIAKGIQAGCNTDSPGAFLVWFCKQKKVYAMKMPGKRYDIGSIEEYQKKKNHGVG